MRMHGKQLKNIFPKTGGRVLFNERLSGHTTFATGGPCEAWVEITDEKALKDVLVFARRMRKRVFVIGAGSNVLAPDAGFKGVVMRLDAGGRFGDIRFSGTKITAGAAASLSRLAGMACEKGLGGMEGLAGIPGTLGGAIFMNAGYKGNASDCLEEIRVMDKKSGATGILKRKNLQFSYRHSGMDDYIILEAAFKLRKAPKKELRRRMREFLREKKKSQPLGRPSAGCVFKNPAGGIPAARYIEVSHLKGARIGGAQISLKHANFIINSKGAKSGDILRLISLVKRRVKARFNVDLETEIIVI